MMIWLIVAAVAVVGLLWFLGRKEDGERSLPDGGTSGSGGFGKVDAIQHLIRIASPDVLPMTESMMAFHMRGDFQKDLGSLAPDEVDGAVRALGMMAEGDVRAGAGDEAQRKLLGASGLAFGGRGPVSDIGWEQIALATYNVGAVEAAFVMMKQMGQAGIVRMQVEPALGNHLGAVPDGASLDDWLAAAIAWRRQYLHGAAAEQYDAAIAALS